MQIPPPLTFCSHEKISLKKHPTFNEAWLQDRIADDPSILGFGDVRLLDRERTLTVGGRLDVLALRRRGQQDSGRYDRGVELEPHITDD